MNANIRIVICALLGFYLSGWVMYHLPKMYIRPDMSMIFFGFIATVIGTVIFFITNPYFTKPDKAESESPESSEIIKQIDGTTVILLYILSFFIPLAGFIVGAIYASKDEGHYKHVGKNCLIFSVLNIVLDVIIIAVMLGSM